MMASERKIQALRSMASSGTPHEAAAAKRILARLNIEERVDEPQEWFKFVCRNEYEKKLLSQTASMVLDRNDFECGTKRHGRKNTLYVKCTKSEHVELELFFTSYCRAVSEEMEITLQAFFQKNRIFSTQSMCAGEAHELTDEERRILKRAEDVERLSIRKQIEAGRVSS